MTEGSEKRLRDVVLAPVSEAAPAGVSARYEPTYELLTEEMRKLSDISAPQIDWKVVVSTAQGIVADTSKDMMVVSYLCAGLFEVGGYERLADGLDGLLALNTTYWETLFPPVARMRARVSAIEWLSERLEKVVTQRPPNASDLEATERCLTLAEAIRDDLGERLGHEAPALGDLRRALRGFVEELKSEAATLEQAELESAAAPASTASPPIATPLAAEPVPAISAEPPAPTPTLSAPPTSTPAPALNSMARVLVAIQEASRAAQKIQPSSSLSVRLACIAAWEPLEALPTHVDGKTQIQPLGASHLLVEQFEQLVAAADWKTLLEKTQYHFSQSVFWFDTQRFLSLAYAGLGPAYEGCKSGAEAELTALIERLPELLDLRFNNDTPFANDDTKAWIRTELISGSTNVTASLATSSTSSADDGGEQQVIDEVIATARQLTRDKSVAEALPGLGIFVSESNSRRQRFLRLLGLSSFLYEVKEHRLALSQLRLLDEEIQHFRLELWEPDLASQVLIRHLESQRVMLEKEWKDSPTEMARADELLTRLARLDVASAFTMNTGR